jgi:hypothetical protein
MGRPLRPLILWLLAPARRGRSRLLAYVSMRLANTLRQLAPTAEQTPELTSLGLDMQEIELACARYRVDGLVQRIDGRGPTAAHLHRIAWHGSAIADIACPPEYPAREQLLLDAALLNLAVALTDSLVDEQAPVGAHAGRVLDPEKLERRLHAPADPHTAIGDSEHDLEAFYGLWDVLLVRLGERFAADREALARLAGMLARMHRSEFAVDADRLPAKVLPIEFIGAMLEGCAARPVLDQLYHELGELIALHDDWRDLALDVLHMRANQLILARDATAGERLRYLARSARRVIFVKGLTAEVIADLSTHMARVLELAGTLSPGSHARAASYLKGLLGC